MRMLGALALAVVLPASALAADDTGKAEREAKEAGREAADRAKQAGREAEDKAKEGGDRAKQATREAKAGKPAPSAVIPHTTMTLASIDSSKAWVAGLSDMAKQPEGWDAGHANMYVSQLQRDLQMANTHLAHLSALAKNNPDTQRDFQQAETALTQAERSVRSWGANLTADAARSGTKSVWDNLDKAQSRIGALAKNLGAPAKLGSP